jgi:dUTP pyrophosphatase
MHGNTTALQNPHYIRLETTIRFAFEPGYQTQTPARGSAEAAGFDIAIPLFTDKFIEDFNVKQALIWKEDWGDRDGPATFHETNAGKIEPQIAILDVSRNEIFLGPGCRAIIPSGIRFDIPPGWMLMGANRGGNSSVKGLTYLAHVVDSDYQGVVFMSVWNTTKRPKGLRAGSSLLQLLVTPVPVVSLEFTTPEQLYTRRTGRGEGALGSTDAKETK